MADSPVASAQNVSGWTGHVAVLAALTGWRRACFLSAAGILSALALPPFGWAPLLWLSIPLLLVMLDGAGSWWRAATAGWWWGLGHFVAGLYWIGIALLVDPERFAWMLPLADLGVPAGLALFPALATGLIYALSRPGGSRLLVAGGVWMAADMLRGHILSGFPWNLFATTVIQWPAAAEGASLVGAYGLSGVVVLVAGLPYLGWRRTAGGGLAAAITTVMALGLIGHGVATVPGEAPRVEPILPLRVVQGNIDQRLKYDEATQLDQLRTLMALSAVAPAAGTDMPRLIIWPETALPWPLETDPRLAPLLGSLVPDNGAVMVGALRLERAGDGLTLWNSLRIIRSDGTVAASYDKHALVPFGEFLPLRSVLGRLGIDKLAASGIDLAAGPGPRTLAVPDLPPVGPMICYEAIFPEAARPAVRPDWLVNVTNDAWFGRSSGPYQHLAAARLRAVEQGLPLVRAANTGISALIDPFGRVEQALALGQSGIIDGLLPAPRAATVYSRFGLIVPVLLCLGLIGAGLLTGRRPPD